jgi:hypothetical protein
MGKKNPRVWDLGDGKKTLGFGTLVMGKNKPLGFGTLVMGKKKP